MSTEKRPSILRSGLLRPGCPPHQLKYGGRRSPVLGRHAAVASSQTLATDVGAQILRKGGNAVDAAIAVAAALAVTEPCSTGLGGDAFMLFFEAQTKTVHGVNGSGRCAAALGLDTAIAASPAGATHLPRHSAHGVTVPGAAALWVDSVARYGSGHLSLAELLEPAAVLAEDGFPVNVIASHMWENGERQLRREVGGGNGAGASGSSSSSRSMSVNGAELLMPNGRAPRPGEVFSNPTLASVLRELGAGGKEAFYGDSRISRAIVDAVRAEGGLLSLGDLAAHTTTFPEPISVEYGGVKVFEVPPNGQGITALLALNILRHYAAQNGDESFGGSGGGLNLQTGPLGAPGSAKLLHLQIEALRLAFADTRYFCADPDVVAVPVAELLSEEYAAKRAALIDPERATADVRRGCPAASSCTVSFQVVDAAGNAASFVNSNYEGFGTGIVPRGCGFSLQNRGANFSLEPGHPNVLAPGKRPYHTIIPGLATVAATGDLFCTFTNMGGFMQPQGHVQLICALVDQELDAQSAVDAPRFCILDGAANGRVALEEDVSADVVERLKEMGHDIVTLRGADRSYNFGRAQVIAKDAAGVLWAGSDGRGDGCAHAW